MRVLLSMNRNVEDCGRCTAADAVGIIAA